MSAYVCAYLSAYLSLVFTQDMFSLKSLFIRNYEKYFPYVNKKQLVYRTRTTLKTCIAIKYKRPLNIHRSKYSICTI